MSDQLTTATEHLCPRVGLSDAGATMTIHPQDQALIDDFAKARQEAVDRVLSALRSQVEHDAHLVQDFGGTWDRGLMLSEVLALIDQIQQDEGQETTRPTVDLPASTTYQEMIDNQIEQAIEWCGW